MEISQEYSRMVWEDAIEAIENPDHPCHHFFDWQARNGYFPYQLPEPFSGRKAELGIAFIGLNPGITATEVFPCYVDSLTFEEYDAFFRRRFESPNRDEKGKLVARLKDGSTKRSRLWNNIERFGNNYLQEICGGPFRLGEHAILSQAIRFKSKEGWYGDSQEEKNRTLAHQQRFVEALIEKEGISLFIPMGNLALEIMAALLEFNEPIPASIKTAMGSSYEGRTRSGKRIILCPIQHLSRGPSHADQRRVAEQIISSYGALAMGA